MRRLSAAANAELSRLRLRAQGDLLPEQIVSAASSEASALHSYFEWDDTEAARQHRLSQARLVLRMSIEVVSEDHDDVRMFVSLSTDRLIGGGYRRLRDVMNDPEQRAILLEDALAELRQARTKYKQLQELDAVWDALGAVETKRNRKPGGRKAA